MNKLILAAVAALFAFAGAANAGGLYGTVKASMTQTEIGNFEADDVYGGGVGIGYNLMDWVAVEGTWDYLGEDTVSGIDVEGKSYGGWVVVNPTVATVGNIAIKPTARVGFVNTELSGGGLSINDTALAYGAGLALGVTENVDVLAEWTRRTIDQDAFGGADDIDFDTYSLGIKFNF